MVFALATATRITIINYSHPPRTAFLPHMRYRHFLLALVLLLPERAANAVEPSDLKPGLIATYSDVRDGISPEVTRLEPTVALTLASKAETPHPALETGGIMKWKGYVNITRRGSY